MPSLIYLLKYCTSKFQDTVHHKKMIINDYNSKSIGFKIMLVKKTINNSKSYGLLFQIFLFFMTTHFCIFFDYPAKMHIVVP